MNLKTKQGPKPLSSNTDQIKKRKTCGSTRQC
jgi:hypothetical protein